eukprot:gene9626-10641_t
MKSHGNSFLDHMLRSRKFLASSLSLKVRRKIAFGLRTAWSVLLCLILMHYWEWATIAMYLSPVISIIAAAPYFGLWQENIFKVSYAVLICTAAGVVVGLSYKTRALQLVLIFLVVFWINRMPKWDRLSIVQGTLSFYLGAVWPTITKGAVTGLKAYRTILALLLIPYLITGISLLFPRPALACYYARFKALLICRKVSHLITAVVKAFLSYDDVDFCFTEFDQYHSEILDDITILKTLSQHVDYERLIFPSLTGMPAALQVLLEVIELSVQELVGLKEMLKRITFNKTQEHYASHLQRPLHEMAEEMDIALTMVGEHFDSFDPFRGIVPACVRSFLRRLWPDRLSSWLDGQVHVLRRRMREFMHIPNSQELLYRHLRTKNRLPDQEKSLEEERSIKALHHYPLAGVEEVEEVHADPVSYREANGDCLITFQQAIDRLCGARSEMLFGFLEIRRGYLEFRSDESKDHPLPTPYSSTSIADRLASAEAMVSLLREEKSLIEERQRMRMGKGTETEVEDEDFSHPISMDEDPQRKVEDEICSDRLDKLTMREETMRLRLHNFGARGAYFHRISVVVEYLASLQYVLILKGRPFHFFAFVQDYVIAILNYLLSTVTSIWEGWLYCRSLYEKSPTRYSFVLDLDNMFVKTYSTALKPAIVITICSAILIYHLMDFLYNGGFWMALVAILIRQDSISSSFLTSMQRLEGTVVGAMYAFLIYSIFHCDREKCGFGFSTPATVLWVAVCGFFRDGPHHGYSATVASFTPVILLLGSGSTLNTAWGRIEETFVGIAIYLVVDNIILPKRTYSVIKSSVLTCIEQTRLVFKDSVKGVETLIKLETFSWTTLKGGAGSIPSVKDLAVAGLGIYGTATDVRYRSGSVAQEMFEQSNSNSGGQEEERRTSFSVDIESLEETHDESISQPIRDLLASCSTCFLSAEKKLNIIRGELLKQRGLLSLVQFEPDLWRRSFPQNAYQRLLDTFIKVYRSALALNSGSKAFTVVLTHMLRRGENISQHLDHFKYMINHLFLVSTKADEALLQAYEAFQKLYARSGEEVDLSSLLALRRVCDKLLEAVEEHFHLVYLRQPPAVLLTFNPYFLVAWQDVFESAQDLIKDLSELGMVLLTVRDIEGILSI